MDLIKFIFKLLSSPLGISFLTILACCCYYYLDRVKNSYKPIIQIIYLFILIFVLYRFYSTVNYRINIFFVWDFTAWFLWGKVAAQGLNFYLPESSQIIYNTLNLPAANFEEFVDAIVNVGFLYPPPTMLYFWALGYMPLDLALKVWTSFIIIFLFACIYLVYIEFFRKDRLNGFMLASILVLILPMVNFTIVCSQTNFILLFYLLLLRKYADHKFAGVLLALAFFTKPFMLIFGLFFLLSKNWKAIAYFIVSALVISGITAFAFGIDTFMSYFFNNTTQRLPAWTFSEDVNQSLHAALLRANLISIDKPHVYLIIASIVLVATVIYLLYLQKRKQSDYIWAILLLVGLLIYPGTLNYYGVVLLFVTFQFFTTEKPLGLNLYLLIPVIGIFYYLNSVSVFASICLLLVIVVLKSLWQLKNNEKSIGLASAQ